MTRCVLRYRNIGEPPIGDLERIANDHDVRMLDRASLGLALIEVPDHALPRLRQTLPGWRIQPEERGGLP